jgi:hypothetical protein
MRTVESQQVSWWSVHEFVTAAIQHADISSWPSAGTPAWCALADGDPRKWAAMLTAGEQWALRIDILQEASAEAAKSICRSVKELDRPTTWSAIAKEAYDLEAFYAARPWLRRVVV